MKRDDHIDFFVVKDEHLAIHGQLEQWARWVKVRPHGWQCSPMFRQYRSKAWQWARPEPRPATNVPEAVAMEKAVSLLPEKHREAIRWSYVFPGNPAAMARRLAVTPYGLRELVNDARSMLKNVTC
jgi:DNA-directed RNA polymerase specialized sigma24 family protein